MWPLFFFKKVQEHKKQLNYRNVSTCRQTPHRITAHLKSNLNHRPPNECLTSMGWCWSNVGQEDSLETQVLFSWDFLWQQMISRLLHDKWPTQERLCACVRACVWRPSPQSLQTGFALSCPTPPWVHTVNSSFSPSQHTHKASSV